MLLTATGEVTVDIGESGLVPGPLGILKQVVGQVADRLVWSCGAFDQVGAAREMQGLVNCMQLVSDGRIGRCGSVNWWLSTVNISRVFQVVMNPFCQSNAWRRGWASLVFLLHAFLRG